MRRVVFMCLGMLLVAVLSSGQVAAPAQQATGHGAFPVKLTKTMDSSRLKEGDPVEVETAGAFKLVDGTLVPLGSKLTGHILSAKSRSKGDADSELAIEFEKLAINKQKELTIKGTVQAVFPPAEESMGPNMSTMGTSAGGSQGGGGLGASGNAGGVGLTNSQSGSNSQSTTTPQLEMDPKSVGVQGMHDLQLNNGVITSKGKNVKLGTGVRMIVHVDIYSQLGT